MELELNLVEQGQNLIRHGGIFIWCIVAISIAALVISLERFYMLKVRYRANGRKLFEAVKRQLIEGNVRGAEEVCEEHEGVPLAQLMRAGISAAGRRGRQNQLDIAIESELLNSIPLISQRLNYLPSLANVATLFGLLGTIAGLIVAFKSTGGISVGGMTQEQGLAAGIAVAMYNTAFGLVVAIPTTLSYLFLSNTANAQMDDLDRYASALKRLVLELGLIDIQKGAQTEIDEEAIAETSNVEKRTVAQEKLTPAHDRLDRAQREVALESKTPTAILKPAAEQPARQPAKSVKVSVPKQVVKEVARVKEDSTILLDIENRISVTQALRAQDIEKPFSEETEKLFASAITDSPSAKAEKFSSEKTKITNRDRSGLEDITDELTTPDLPGSRKS